MKPFKYYTVADTWSGRLVIGRHYTRRAAENFVRRDGKRWLAAMGDARIEVIARGTLPGDLVTGADLRGPVA